jgi:23S rRNA (cytidine1920-2'-O)/16S rRNA (cytidine1409-2'-O)-methyltransferase
MDQFGLAVSGLVCADFGCSTGGFTDCLLQEGAARVYAVDTGSGMLAWKLRQDARVVVLERTNAMHVQLPEPVDAVTADVAWTRQRHILPRALRSVRRGGFVLSLFKPQYEAPRERVRRGRVEPADFDGILAQSLEQLVSEGIRVRSVVRLPHERRSKNPEAFLLIRPADCAASATCPPEAP